MPVFKMVKYNKREYPPEIPLNIQEVAGHFDVKQIAQDMPYSLHTEYSYGKRDFKNHCLACCPRIIEAEKQGIPMLWHSESWAIEFANYITNITKDLYPPDVIEIHPPFSDYCTMDDFLARYALFEEQIRAVYPNTRIFIENRYGSLYRGSQFLISKSISLIQLAESVANKGLALRITLDVPQLLGAHQSIKSRSFEVFEELPPLLGFINGVHLWGKKRSNGKWASHCGDLSSYFEYDDFLKRAFLEAFSSTFDDGKPRFLVLEVNSSNEDASSIINDLESINTKFI